MKRVLILAYAFPPIPYSGSYRILRLCKALNALNVEPHVLTIKTDSRIPNDYKLLEKVPDGVHVHRISILDPWLWFRDWIAKKPYTAFYKVINKIVSLLLRFLTIPDHQIFWVPFAVFKGFFVIRKNKIKSIIVSSPPNSTLLSGCLLKRFAKIHFIADLRDPIVGNIAQVNLIHPTTTLSKIELSIHKWLERIVIKNADIVVTNTETHNRAMKSKYAHGHRASFLTIRNSFDPDDYLEGISEKHQTFTISHLGAIYGLRKVDLLFQGVKNLEQRMASSGKKLELQIQLVGSISSEVDHSIRVNGVERYVKLISRIPHKEAIETMLRSDALLLVKATGPQSLGQIPAKFFEYIGTGNPILCIGPKESEVAGLIKKYNLGFTIEDSVDEMVEAIQCLMQNRNSATSQGNQPLLAEFDNIKMAKEMQKLII